MGVSAIFRTDYRIKRKIQGYQEWDIQLIKMQNESTTTVIDTAATTVTANNNNTLLLLLLFLLIPLLL